MRSIFFGFGLSSAAALIYETAWLKSVTYLVGTTVYVLSIVVALFLAGVAIGSYIGGQRADKSTSKTFAKLEIAIGLLGLVTISTVFSPGGIFFDILSFVMIIILTMLIGMTFPIVIKLTAEKENVRKGAGITYFYDTFGAAMGVLVAGFVLMPFIGISLTIAFAAGLNIIAALIVWRYP